MNFSKKLIFSFALLGSVLATSQTWAATAPVEQAAVAANTVSVIAISGQATATINGKVTPLQNKSKIPAGASIAVPPGSSLTLLLANGTTLTIAGGSQFIVSTLTENGANITLNEGAITVNSDSATNAVVISTPDATTTVNQGIVRVAVSGNATDLIVVRGDATLAAKGQPALTIPAGSGASVTPGADSAAVQSTAPTQADQQAVLETAQKANEAAQNAPQPIIPEQAVQSEETSPSNPTFVISTEQTT